MRDAALPTVGQDFRTSNGLGRCTADRETAPPAGAGSPAPFGEQSVCFSFEVVAKLQKLWRFYIETQISVSS